MTVRRWLMVVTRLSAAAFVWTEQTRAATTTYRYFRRTAAMLRSSWSSMPTSPFLGFRKTPKQRSVLSVRHFTDEAAASPALKPPVPPSAGLQANRSGRSQPPPVHAAGGWH
jgi:hypothetical protein